MASIQFDCHLHQYDIPKNKHKCYCHANSKADLSVLLNPHYLSIVNPRRCLTGLTCKQKTCKIETISTNCYIPTWQWFQIMVPTTVTQIPSQNFNVCGFCHTNVRAMVRIMIPGSLLRNEMILAENKNWIRVSSKLQPMSLGFSGGSRPSQTGVQIASLACQCCVLVYHIVVSLYVWGHTDLQEKTFSVIKGKVWLPQAKVFPWCRSQNGDRIKQNADQLHCDMYQLYWQQYTCM